MASRTTNFDWTTGFCDSMTAVYIPISPWMAAADIANVRGPFELRDPVECKAAFQEPDGRRTFGAGNDQDIAANTDGFQDPTSDTDFTTNLTRQK